MGARAFAVGNQIHFANRAYGPDSSKGQRLIAHEAIHTVQQSGPAPEIATELEVSSAGDQTEREADAVADAFVAGVPSPGSSASPGESLHRDVDGTEAERQTRELFNYARVGFDQRFDQYLAYMQRGTAAANPIRDTLVRVNNTLRMHGATF